MNYSKKFNTIPKAIAEIKRLEKKNAKLAKRDLCDWSITLEQHIEDKDKEIEKLQIKNDNQKKIIQGTHRYGWSTEQREEVTRLKSEIVQFRKTQDYQSDKIGELQLKLKDKDVDLKFLREINSGCGKDIDKIKEQRDAFSELLSEKEGHYQKDIKKAYDDYIKMADTIIRQANELTDLKAGV